MTFNLLSSCQTPRRASFVRHAVAGFVAAVVSCASISRLNLIPVEQDAQLGAQAYPELLEGERTITSGKDYEMVQRVTQRLVEAANHFDPEISAMFEWEARLVDKPDMVNAWCLPGGKMAVFTGILPVSQNEAGLAVVMGHEIAHATQRHGTRAMTRQLGAATLVNIAAVLIFDAPDSQQMAAAIGTYTAGFANLKFGRDAELEADAVGLKYMARAGYDPREATQFWSRMQALSGGAAGPAWLSTHPSHGSRIEQIEGLLPEALAIYAESGGTK
jgi:predicted Zn-dependent protease